MNPLDRLIAMLRYRRPAGSITERVYINTFIADLPGAQQDAYRNWHVRVGDPAGLLWSSHTDTVHRMDGLQRIKLNPRTGMATLSDRSLKKGSNCLGADDTVGNWLMVELIHRGVPGHYVFHYGEEKGCIGSHDLAHYRPDWLKQFNIAIALDRRGDRDIITHQAGGRCASDAFAYSLADIINSAGPFSYEPCPHGIYTDTASYTDIIAECTNVSVGYQGEHWKEESVDTEHALFLLDALCGVRAELLTVEREPGDDGWDEDDGQWKYVNDGHGYYWYRVDDNEHDDKCPCYDGYPADYCTCGAASVAEVIRLTDAKEKKATTIELDEDGVPKNIDTSSYLDREYARVTEHLRLQQQARGRKWCERHGFHDGPQVCDKCAAEITVRTVEHDPNAMKPGYKLLLGPAPAEVNGNVALTPSQLRKEAKQSMPLVRAWRRQKYNIRKRRHPKRLKGGWALGPGTKEGDQA